MAIYYVSTTGSDGAAGTEGAPWLTLQHAADTIVAGDTVNVFPGTYTNTIDNQLVDFTTDGTSGAPITIQGYGGRPLLDGSTRTPTNDTEIISLRADWYHIKNIDVRGAQQLADGNVGTGVGVYNASNNIIESVRAYENEGSGFLVGSGSPSSNNLLLNCDSYSNYDPLTVPDGGNADGFVVGPTGSGNVLDGCRAWLNSDDGFDLWEAESVVILRRCWAWSNGSASGDGNGFKLGRNDTSPRHQVHQCLAFDNMSYGFNTNSAAGPVELLNNTSYNNGIIDYGMDASIAHVMTNNIGRDATNPPAATLDTFNSWNLVLPVSAADFRSVSSALASAPRNPDGSLPINDLFRLAFGSDLINVGTWVGLPYSGSAPDLGAFELGPIYDAKIIIG